MNKSKNQKTSFNNMLYKKHIYLDKNIDYLFSVEIVEYDMKDAGFSLIKEFKLLSDNQIRKLSKMRKHRRKVMIGIIQRNKEFAKILNEKFIEARKMFFEANGLDESNVLSIKRDAVFTMKYCETTKFGEIEFRIKNEYTSYLYLNNYEFYYNKHGVDAKGIGDNQKYHDEYMIDIFSEFCKLMEISSTRTCIKFIKDFSELYKVKKLEIGYYRELNSESMYKTYSKCFDFSIYVENFYEYDNLDISYNYFKYIVPLMNILM